MDETKKFSVEFAATVIGASKYIQDLKNIESQTKVTTTSLNKTSSITQTPWGLRGPGGKFVSRDPQKDFGFKGTGVSGGGGNIPPIIGTQMDLPFGDGNWGGKKKGFLDVSDQINKTTKATKDLGKATKEAEINVGKLAERALITIPIWLALRSAFMAVIQTFQAGIQHIIEFDKALARAKSVLTGVSDIDKFMTGLAGQIRKTSAETGISAGELAESFYRFGSAGLDAETALAGMNISAKTSIALMGDLTETSRMLADVYILLGDKLTNMKTPQEKMNYLASTIAVLWKENTFELNEFTEGIKTFTASASSFNLTADQMMALLAASSTLMQRGAAGGTQLSRVFIQLAQKSELAGRYLNTVVDPKKTGYWELFVRVVAKMNAEIQAGIPIMDEIVDLFDIRASKSVAGFAQKFDLLVKQIQTANMSPADKNKAFEKFFETQMDTIDRQLKIMNELKKQTVEAFLIGITGTTDYIAALERINNFIKNNIIPTTMWWSEIAKDVSGKIMGRTGLEREDKRDEMEKRFMERQAPFVGRSTAEIEKEERKRLTAFEDILDEFENTADVWGKKNILAKAFGYSESESEEIALLFTGTMDKVQYRLSKMYSDIDTRTLEQVNKEKVLKQLKEEGIGAENKANRTLEYKLLMLDRMRLAGNSEIEVQRAIIKLYGEGAKKKEEELKLQQMINDETLKQRDAIASLAIQYEKAIDEEKYDEAKRIERAAELVNESPESVASSFNDAYDKSIILEFWSSFTEEAKKALEEVAISNAGFQVPTSITEENPPKEPPWQMVWNQQQKKWVSPNFSRADEVLDIGKTEVPKTTTTTPDVNILNQYNIPIALAGGITNDDIDGLLKELETKIKAQPNYIGDKELLNEISSQIKIDGTEISNSVDERIRKF